MRVRVPIAVLASMLLAAPLFAQTTTTTTPAPLLAQTTTTTTTTSTTTEDRDYDTIPNEYIVAGFVGGSFARNSLNTSVDFGGAFDYLHNGAFGAEFLAGFAPRFKLDRLAGNDSDVNNYMGNVIASVPVGAFKAVRPFVSAGIGAITLSQNTNTSTSGVVNTTAALFAPSETHFGGNIGAGIMAFTGAYGIRADVRYFSALGHKNANNASVSLPGPSPASVLDSVSFWRANVGFAFRF